ncbi:MAG: MFS transporter [Chloroflexota bacterium]
MNINSQDEITRRNKKNVLYDAIGVSIASVAAPFLPVFLTRLGASNFQVGLLSSMPVVTGFFLAIILGRFLQTRKNIIPWYSVTRLLVISCYTLTGMSIIFLPGKYSIIATLIIWAAATIPSTALGVLFSVVMNHVAGPDGRYALLSRRWAIFGLTGVIFTFFVTRMIDLIKFPNNYAVMFIILSFGGLLSYYFSNRIVLPDQKNNRQIDDTKPINSIQNYIGLLKKTPAFTSFSIKSFVYISAVTLAAPIMPLYFVHNLKATDSEIGMITMIMTSGLLVGYFFWPWISKKQGGRFILLTTAAGMVLYPALTANTQQVKWIYLFSGVAGIFQAGLDLVFFDELMKTVPPEFSATFVSISQSLTYFATITEPILGTFLADKIGLGGALLFSAGLRLIGFLLFLLPDKIKLRPPG